MIMVESFTPFDLRSNSNLRKSDRFYVGKGNAILSLSQSYLHRPSAAGFESLALISHEYLRSAENTITLSVNKSFYHSDRNVILPTRKSHPGLQNF